MKRLTLYSVVRLLFALSAIFSIPAKAQEGSLRQLIHQVEQHNPHLSIASSHLEAQKLENLIGLNPDDPKVSVNYLRPNPRLRDSRFDYEITQELAFPSVYVNQKKVANLQNAGLDQEWNAIRQEVVEETLQTWLFWVFLQQQHALLEEKKAQAEKIAEAHENSFKQGNISALERNKARLHAAQVQKEAEFVQIELESAWQSLVKLNGGNSIQQVPLRYPEEWVLPASFEDWYSEVSHHVAAINQLKNEVKVSKARERLAGAMRLPNLQIGFMREQDIEVDFKGVTVGLSIPLWQHQNRSKHAKFQRLAAERELEEESLSFYLQLQKEFAKAKALQSLVSDLQSIPTETTNLNLLLKAFELGQLTLVDYLVEQSMYYEVLQKKIEAEYEYYTIQARLRSWLY
jgi:cobalt-zinc-cadmium efflux system outer membrane protein